MSSKKSILFVAAIVSTAFAATGFAADGAWFDMDKCTMCKPIMQTPGLMESIQHEQIPLSKGIVTVTTVGDQHLKSYRQAHAEMQAIAARAEKGENIPLCGSCTALLQLMPKGVEQDFAETKHGDVWILTSSDPAVAAQLKAWAKRNNDEMAKMMSATKTPAKM